MVKLAVIERINSDGEAGIYEYQVPLTSFNIIYIMRTEVYCYNRR